MKNILHISLVSLLAVLLAAGCSREPLLESGSGKACTGKEVIAPLSFAPEDNTIVVTKAAVSDAAESRVLNLFVFLFDANGNKIYSQYFDSSNKQSVTSTASLTGEGWWVNNSASPVKGGVSLQTSSGSGYKIYAMANLDADMVRVSSDLLSHNINDEQDLLDFSVYLNQEITSRNGYFPMTGKLTDLKIADDGTITKTDGSAAGTLMLRRLDAKVKFIFKTGSREDAAGQTIKSFTAKQWKVINVPATSFLVERDSEDAVNVDPATATSEYVNYAPKFFDTEWTNFEEFPDDKTSSFTFYMLENRQTPKNTSITSYQDRSRQVKQSSGYHEGENETVTVEYTSSRGMDVSREMRVFRNANDFSTYVLVTGNVEMELENDDEGKTLGGEVQYLIHLGDWSYTKGSSWDTDTYGSFNNFNTERNTFYTYTVTVNSVNNIRVEVETSTTENQPGATGQVTIAKEEIAVCDAHYYSKTMTFHASNFFEGVNSTADDLTWSVKTPFSDGTPSDPLTPGTLDYDWVHFRLNKKNSDGTYNTNRRKFVSPDRKFETTTDYRDETTNAEGDGTAGLAGYHNDGLMNIVDLVKYIKEQVKILEEYYKNPGMTYEGDFDNPDDKEAAKICVTAFVDEYYYEKNPVTGVSSPTLWKKFVNQDDRTLHILCNSNVSKDLESRATGSVITIQQHAIQSIYNTDESETSLQSAWGLEYVDEFTDAIYTYNTNSSTYTGSYSNTSQSDGLYNSVKEWELSGTPSWSKYMNFEKANDLHQMQSGYAALRYICLSRNRDNNGDGVIDPDEVRWYTASIRQLIGLYVGNGVIDHHSRLYYRSASEQTSSTANTWRQHVISSTLYGSGQPTVVWGEEGISTGNISGSIQWGGGLSKFGVRCVRNLGKENPSSLSFSEGDYEPEDYVDVETSGSGTSEVYTFNATHLNKAALRYYTSRELDYHSHTSDINRLYKRFEVLPTAKATTTSNMNFKTLNDNVTTAINAGNQNPYCPEGYRLPNQSELAMLKYYNVISSDMVSRTYWAFGTEREDGIAAKEDKYGYIYAGGNISLESSGKAFVCRCVRDIRTD